MEEKRGYDDSFMGTESEPSAPKHAKPDTTTDSAAGVVEFPRTRHVIMRFSSTGQEVPGRIVSRETFGILARAEEDAPPVRLNDRFWTKWCGSLQPLSRIPIVEVRQGRRENEFESDENDGQVVHAVKTE